MNIEEAKKEFIRRYKYLYENAEFILSPYMCEQSEEEFQKRVNENIKKYNQPILKKPVIYLNINRLDSINAIFEEFLLSDKPLEESKLYHMIEENRTNKDYLDKVKKGLELLEKDNKDTEYEILKTKLNLWEILTKVANYIEEQSGDLNNKRTKMYVLDQYYRLARYRNDGKIYTSGRNLNLHDVNSLVIDLHEREPIREKKDIGVEKNSFLTSIEKTPYYEYNWSIFTEEEKQEIYLEYHDELPYYLQMNCELEDEYIKTMIESRLQRPQNTSPCNQMFRVSENEIFINPNDKLYRYYQLCPHCGYIVNIPKEIMPQSVKDRIEERCSKDTHLFRKMFLYSELFSLDNNSTKEQRRMLKK